MEFLVFELTGPMACFANQTGITSQKTSQAYPGRSHIAGFLGACCGVQRQDLPEWASTLRYGCRVAHPPTRWLSDFQTVQAPGGQSLKKNAPATRREELSLFTPGRDNAVIYRRDYLYDFHAVVAACGLDLSTLVGGLNSPTWTPYLGVKSSPLSRPPSPSIVSCGSVNAALDTRALEPGGDGWLYAWDPDLPNGFGGCEQPRIMCSTAQDVPRSCSATHNRGFGSRNEMKLIVRAS